ncbi:MAG: endonuclease domain-containing protein [Alphaproteobacteria bacterium]|nr:endonuclease domain-containing protein [Alphaproteobacteria bacterium]
MKNFKILYTNQTDVESRLWYHLRSRRFPGWTFRHQRILQSYIVDFVCLEKRLVIELDGGQHVDQKAYDIVRKPSKRTDHIIRFWNNEVLSNLVGVLQTILHTPHPPLRDDLSHKGRGKISHEVALEKISPLNWERPNV